MIRPVVAAVGVFLVCVCQAAGRDWTVRDSVALRQFVTDWVFPGIAHEPGDADRPARFSPDGRHFFLLSWRGDVSQDRTVYELWIYSTPAVERALKRGSTGREGLMPLKKIAMRSHLPGIWGSVALLFPRWESDRTLTFVGMPGDGSRLVYRYDLTTDELKPLIDPTLRYPGTGVMSYSVRGSSIVFLTWEPYTRRQDDYPVGVVDHNRLSSILGQNKESVFVRASYKGAAPRLLAEIQPMTGYAGPWISPDERWAVMVFQPKGYRAPAEWSGYSFRPMRRRYMLMDLQSGLTQPLLPAPPGPEGYIEGGPVDAVEWLWPVFWSADSRRLLILNAALPLDSRSPHRRDTAYAVDYEVASGQWNVVEAFPRSATKLSGAAAWLEPGRQVIASHRDAQGKRIEGSIYTFNDRHWTAQPAGDRELPQHAEPKAGIEVRVRQGMNDPTRIVVLQGKKELTLTEPDPALRDVHRAPAEPIHWNDSTGVFVESLLTLPRNFDAKKGAPLVVQLSDFTNPPAVFWPDGQPGTGFAAQTLAAQGFSVLQTEPAGFLRRDGRFVADDEIFLTPREGPAQVRRLDDTLDMLRRRGLKFQEPIGLIGFSRSGFYVYYVTTHPGQTKIGAAVPFDSIRYGYADYVNLAAVGDVSGARDLQRVYENKSFWENKEGWLDAPVFNLDKLKTPLLFQNNGDDWRYGADIVGAFTLARRPYESLYYPGGYHTLSAPRQQEAALQATVDWMNFWLQDREREGDMTGRFERWRAIEAEWQQVQQEEAGVRQGAP